MPDLGSYGGDTPTPQETRKKIGQGGGVSLPDQSLEKLQESPFGAYTVGRFVIGTFSRDTTLASGTQSVTGVGFRPYFLYFLGAEGGTREVTWGFENGTTRQGIAAEGGAAGTTFAPQAGRSARFDEGGSNIYDITSATMDIDGFTVTWDKTGSPTGTVTVQYMAFARG